jgi:hypothetical protein
MKGERLRALGSSNWPQGWVGPVVFRHRELLALLARLLLGRSGVDALRRGGGAGGLGSLGDWPADAGGTEEEHVVWSIELFELGCVCGIECMQKTD